MLIPDACKRTEADSFLSSSVSRRLLSLLCPAVQIINSLLIVHNAVVKETTQAAYWLI